MKHKVYNRTPKKDFKEQVKKYIDENKLNDSLIPYAFLYQLRGTLPERIEIGQYENKKLIFEEKKICLRNRHYNYKDKLRITYNLMLSDGNNSILIKDYDTFLNDYYYSGSGKITLKEKYNNLDVIAMLFGIMQKDKKKIERKQFRFSLTDEEHEYVKIFVKRLKQHLQDKSERIIRPNVEEIIK